MKIRSTLKKQLIEPEEEKEDCTFQPRINKNLKVKGNFQQRQKDWDVKTKQHIYDNIQKLQTEIFSFVPKINKTEVSFVQEIKETIGSQSFINRLKQGRKIKEDKNSFYEIKEKELTNSQKNKKKQNSLYKIQVIKKTFYLKIRIF